MASGIDVNIGADTRPFEQAVKSGMVEPVENAQDALEKYAGAGDQAGDQLTRSFEQQQRSTTDLRTDIDRLNDTISTGTRRATSRAGEDVQGFSRRSEEGFEEIRNSAKSNAIEVGASFTGGFDQAVGGLQGFVAEFAAGFGPAGVIAGVGAAALLGVVTNAIDQGQQAAEAQKQAVAELAGEYIDAGKSGKRSFDSTTDAIKAMATSDGSDVIITLQKAWDLAHNSGADYQQTVEAIASGSVSQIETARRAVDRLDTAHASLAHTTTDYAGRVVSSNTDQIKSNVDLQEALKQAEKQAKEAGRAQELAAKAGLSDLSRKRDLISQVEGAYDDAAGATDDFIDKQGQFHAEKYVKEVDKIRTALKHYADDIAKSDLTPAAQHFLEQQGAQSAAAMLTGYQKASPTTKARLNEIWTTSGNENATDYTDAIGKRLKGITVDAPKVKPPVVPAPDTTRIDAYLRTPAVKRIVLDVVTRDGKRVQ